MMVEGLGFESVVGIAHPHSRTINLYGIDACTYTNTHVIVARP